MTCRPRAGPYGWKIARVSDRPFREHDQRAVAPIHSLAFRNDTAPWRPEDAQTSSTRGLCIDPAESAQVKPLM